MSEQDHEVTLQNLRRQHGLLETGAWSRTPPQRRSSHQSDLNKLDAHRQIGLARTAAQALGVASPFFRQIEAIDGTRVRIDGNTVTNFASYDYLSLNQSSKVASEVSKAVATWGVSATASRLVGGECSYHRRLESGLSEFLGVEDTVVLVSGYLTNYAAIRTVMGSGDLVLVDSLGHNSIFEGIHASGAEHLSFPHNDWEWVDRHLASRRSNYRNVLVIVEGLYSMDGDMPELGRFVDVKRRHGAWLMVDEAHSIGVLGDTGRGILEEQSIDPADVDIRMGTLSKTFCSCGGFLAGSKDLTDLIRYAASGFVYSVGVPASSAAAAVASLAELKARPELVAGLRALGRHFRTTAKGHGLAIGDSVGAAVAPIVIGDSIRATWISNALLGEGFNVLPIIAPAVPEKSARLRFFINAAHTKSDIEDVLSAVARLHKDSRDRRA